MSKTKRLKVGFDLDGVILYNPARLSRPVFEFLRSNFLKRKKVKFHIPKTSLSKFIWYLFHKSSLFIAPGYRELKRLIEDGSVEAYIVSGRYNSLQKDFQKWMNRLEAEKYFKQFFYNQRDQQPYEFKRQKIKELQLDIYVEDNWDILEVLQKERFNKPIKLLWLSNPLDWNKSYSNKFKNLKAVVKYLEQAARTS